MTIGLFVSFAWADTGSVSSAAWTQGLQFLGEGLLLSGISFLLGTILWAIRTAGAEVQSGLGVRVKTLKMPTTAKLFVVLMMLGLMISMLQFVLYLVVAGGVANPAAWFAFLGPFREFGLAMILSGIALALVSIGTALDFQFERVVELFRARAQKRKLTMTTATRTTDFQVDITDRGLGYNLPRRWGTGCGSHVADGHHGLRGRDHRGDRTIRLHLGWRGGLDDPVATASRHGPDVHWLRLCVCRYFFRNRPNPWTVPARWR